MGVILPVKTDNLPKQLRSKLETVKKLYDQQKYMYDNHTHSVSDRIVSISQPWLRPIVRGKSKAPVEFGAKLDISVVNLSYCAERKIRLSGPALGRPKKDEICDKKQDYIDESERVEVERKFSLAKRKCGIGLIVTRLKETTCHCLAMSVLLLNLRKIGKVLFKFFRCGFKSC